MEVDEREQTLSRGAGPGGDGDQSDAGSGSKGPCDKVQLIRNLGFI